MVVGTRELREATEVLIQYLEQASAAAVDVPFDYYWDVLSRETYDPTNPAPTLGLGQISEYSGWLKGTLASPDDAVPYSLTWLGVLLRAVGDTIVPAPDNGPSVPTA